MTTAQPENAPQPAPTQDPAPLGAKGRTGPLQPGDRVQLTDAKGRMHTLTLVPGKEFHTHKGFFKHDDLIGGPEGVVVANSAGVEFQVLRPLLSDYVLSMPRGAAIVYPKDAAQIIMMGDVFPGARVLEAGVGSGALTMSLLRAVGEHGHVHSIERRADFADIAAANVEAFFGGEHPAWSLSVGDFQDHATGLGQKFDRVVLDMLAPWECVDEAFEVLEPGGLFLAYVATATQLSRTVEALREHGFWCEPDAWESFVRGWHLEGLAVRPQHRMIGHTGFLVTARRMADGNVALERRRRPAKGNYVPGTEGTEGTDGTGHAGGAADLPTGASTGVDAGAKGVDAAQIEALHSDGLTWDPQQFGEKDIADRKVRRLVREAHAQRDARLAGLRGDAEAVVDAAMISGGAKASGRVGRYDPTLKRALLDAERAESDSTEHKSDSTEHKE